jgi:uncharacterized SAM-binding protein YcdF (DUF218 family)
MIRLFWRIVRALLVLLVVGGGLYLGGPYLLTFAGRYLITQDALVKADIALVLSGQPYLRVPEAARLYHEGLAPKILLVNEPRPRGQEDLFRVGLRYPDSLEISLQLLEALRVPCDAILTIPERADDTQAEADVVTRFFSGRSDRTLIIVTSKAHTTRARKIFSTSLGANVTLVMHPAPADPFDPGRWWQDRVDLGQTVWEYAALADLWRRGFWRAVVGEATLAPPAVTVR